MTVMISLWIAIVAFFLLGLNHFFLLEMLDSV